MVARDSAIRAPFRPAPSRDRVVAIESLEAESKPALIVPKPTRFSRAGLPSTVIPNTPDFRRTSVLASANSVPARAAVIHEVELNVTDRA
jgi:hypothetical protein